MGFYSKLSVALSGLVIGLIPFNQASASSVTYTGTFASDDQVQEYVWTLPQSTTAILYSDSYGGGTSNGVTTPAGGFVPIISLFDSTGTLITSDGADGTCSGSMAMDGVTGMCDDAYIKTNLAAGSYTVAITEFFNEPVGPNLSNGFTEQGQGNFTGPTCGTTGAFYQSDVAPCVERTGTFAVTFSSIPEPGTLWLAVPAIALGFWKRRRSHLPKVD